MACGFAAIGVAAVAQLVLPARGGTLVAWFDCVVLPGFIVTLLLAFPRRDARTLVLACALLYVEAVLLASLYEIGMAFAILLPIVGIGLIEPHASRNVKVAAYVGAVIAATIGFIVVEARAFTNPLGAEYPPLAIAAFGLVASFALGLTWHAGERLRQALDAAARDLAARGEAERRASEAAATLERVIASSPVATVALDAENNVTVWNRAAEQLFGWESAEVIGSPLPLVGRDAERDAGAAAPEAPGARPPQWIERALSAAGVPEPTLVQTRDGRDVFVEVHAARRRADGSAGTAPSGVIVQVVDVTERVALEAQLRQAQKMEAVGHLAGGVAHDINNTLTAVGGFAELIESESDQVEVRQDAAAISRAVERGAELTRRLLAFARRSVLQPQVVQLAQFMASLEPMLRRLLGADVEITVRDEVPGGSVNVDPSQLEQALLNLAVNARDAMPSGGRLSIVISRRPGRVAAVPAERGAAAADRDVAAAERGAAAADRGASIVLAVSDTGVGVPPEVQDRVFDPFFTTKPRGKGTGLGLAMVYGFVTQSGGDVTLASTPGEGTTVEIALPEVIAGPAQLPRAQVATAPGRGSETILVVEDEADVATFAARVLRQRGYVVLVAHDGVEALELARTTPQPIDLILSDVIMPGMAGPDVVRRVRRLHPQAVVVFASGYPADVIAERGALPAGVGLIPKPYTAVVLAERVRAALDARNSAPDCA